MPHLVEEPDRAWVVHDAVHAVDVEHDLPEGAQDQVLQLGVVAQRHQLLQTAARHELVHQVAVRLKYMGKVA